MMLKTILFLMTMGNINIKKSLWVTARALRTKESIDELVEFSQKYKFDELFVQVVVGGYAYYQSDILPRTEYMSEDFDPLGYLVKKIEGSDIKVHAWINTCLYWSIKDKPKDSTHVLYQHPEWFLHDKEGRSMAEYEYEDIINYGVDGLFLDPSREEVREFIADYATEIITRYNVAGIHLDFIRYPGGYWDFSEKNIEDFNVRFHIDPRLISDAVDYRAPHWNTVMTREPHIRYYHWLRMYWNRKRKDAVKGLVKTLKERLQPKELTAAVFANPASSSYNLGQDWREWVNENIIDRLCIMAYTPDKKSYKNFLEYASIYPKDRIVMGVGVYYQDAEKYAPQEISYAIESGYKNIIIFDYFSLKNNKRLLNWMEKRL
ncbi:MAG: family 10 glycosylhydrolase [Candidatus Hydrothermae bacterium]|nr:family 10 glycosylhydrolase [Candidatus Hydrothermae bacterium]